MLKNIMKQSPYFEACNGYSNSVQLLKDIFYSKADISLKSNDYANAISLLDKIKNYKDANSKLDWAKKLEPFQYQVFEKCLQISLLN